MNTATATPMPAAIRVHPWYPEDLEREVTAFNGTVEALGKAMAGEPEERSALRDRLLALDADAGAILDARRALNLHHAARLIEAKRLHLARPALVERCAAAAVERAREQDTAITGRADFLKAKATKSGFSKYLDSILADDDELKELRIQKERFNVAARALATHVATEDAVETIDAALCRWLGEEPAKPERAAVLRRVGQLEGPEPVAPSPGGVPVVRFGGDLRQTYGMKPGSEEATTLSRLQQQMDAGMPDGPEGTLAHAGRTA